MVNLEWYRTFKAIYHTGTLTGAAQELLISQPNVSQHLSALEAHVGRQLFERKPRRMVPTDYGKLFYTQIIEALDKLEHVEAEFRYTRTSNIPLTCIGTSRDFFFTRFAACIGKVPANLVFEFGAVDELMQKLTSGKLYFVITDHCAHEKDIVYEPVLQEQLVLLGNEGLETRLFDQYMEEHDMDEAEKWLCAQDWYAYSSDLVVIRRFWLDNFKKRPMIKPRFVIPDFGGVLKALSYGSGITVAPGYLAADLMRQQQLKVVWNGISPTQSTIHLAYHKNNVTMEQVNMMRKILH